MGNLKQFLDMLKKLMEKGGGEGGGGEPQLTASSTACVSYYQVTTPSSDPCAYYVPPVSSTLFDGSASGINSSASIELMNTLSIGIGSAFGVDSSVDTTSNTNITSAPELTGGRLLSEQAVNVGAQLSPEGTYGDIVTTDTGGTIYARSRDTGQNVEVAGFFGITTFFGKVQSAVANMCRTRPWANSIVSYLIPPSFFDSVCTWRGYQVGIPPPAEPVVAPVKKSVPSGTGATSTEASAPPAVEPKVDIWAVPSNVPLGARASIFWNTKGVESCTITSPDGSFNEHSLSGGAATTPLSGPTTFTISCLTPNGEPVTDYVTVNLTI